jgi:ribosomal protein S18 acetylase RimI-like enzyme
MTISIRELIPETRSEDLEALVPVYLSIWNHSENKRFLSFTGQPFEEAQIREWFGQHIAAGVRYFAAVDPAGQLVGVLVVRVNRIEGFELSGLGVIPEEKRRGVATQLVRHGLAVASEQGYRCVDGQVYATNVPMLCLLLNEGFVPARMEHHRGPGGEDLVHLKKYPGS